MTRGDPVSTISRHNAVRRNPENFRPCLLKAGLVGGVDLVAWRWRSEISWLAITSESTGGRALHRGITPIRMVPPRNRRLFARFSSCFRAIHVPSQSVAAHTVPASWPTTLLNCVTSFSYRRPSLEAAPLNAICIPNQMPTGARRLPANCAARILPFRAGMTESAGHQMPFACSRNGAVVLVLDHFALDPFLVDLDLRWRCHHRPRLDRPICKAPFMPYICRRGQS